MQIAELKQEIKQLKQENKQLKQRNAELEKNESKKKDDESMSILSFQNEQIQINEISNVPKKQNSSKKILATLETIPKSATELRKSTNDSLNKIKAMQQEEEIKKCIDDTLTKDIVHQGVKARLIVKSKAMANYKLQQLEAMKVYGSVSDEEWQQQMGNIDQRQKPEFAQNVYLNGLQVGALHQKIKS